MIIENSILVTLYNVFQSFLDYCQFQKQFSVHTICNYEYDLNKLDMYCRNHACSLESFDRQNCREFIAYHLTHHLTPRSLCRCISVYRAFWDFLWVKKLVSKNPWRQIRLPKIKTVLPNVIATEKMLSFLDNISMNTVIGLRNRTICECLYGMGLRVSELVCLDMASLDISKGECRIIGKRNKERMVVIGDITRDIIQSYILNVRDKIKKSNSKTLILNREGAAMSSRSIQRIVKQCSIKQGINPPLTPHTLRHCYASDLYKGGADISVIKELLGHDYVSTTEIYTHVAMDELRETVIQSHPHG